MSARNHFAFLSACCLTLLLAVNAPAQDKGKQKRNAGGWPEGFDDAKTFVYKETEQADLKLHVFGSDGSADHPALIYFFGGGWQMGNPNQFLPQARHFASRGMVTVLPEYRIGGRHKTSPIQAMNDAKSAVRWVRAHADELGIDPDRIATGGGSAGGHLAAVSGILEDFDEPGEDTAVSAASNAMLLYNPALDVTFIPPSYGFGDEAEAASPLLNLRKDLPPAIVFHGTNDRLVAFSQAERFTEGMKKLGNRCELKSYPAQGHGFFNFKGAGSAPENHPYHSTLKEADDFLVSIGWLEPLSD